MRRIRITKTFRATSDEYRDTSDLRTFESGLEYDVPDDIYDVAISEQWAETVVKAHASAPIDKGAETSVDEAPKPTRGRRRRA